MKSNQFFLGSNTENGFSGYFDNFYKAHTGGRFYIIKGGPGSGKSSLIKRLLKWSEEAGDICEYYPCSSDPQSLDGMYNKTKNFAIIDGTPPHTVEPDYPGAFETIVDTAAGFNTEKLRSHLSEIVKLNDEISACHKKASVCIKSAAALRRFVFYTAQKYVDNKKVKTLVKTHFLNAYPAGKSETRLLSAVSVGETKIMDKTIQNMKNAFIIYDDYGAASDLFLNAVIEIQPECGKTVMPCSVIREKKEHIILGEDTGIFTSNSFHEIKKDPAKILPDLYKKIPAKTETELLWANDTAHILLAHAEQSVKRAKALHDKLEKFYIDAMDFRVIDEIFEKIVSEN